MSDLKPINGGKKSRVLEEKRLQRRNLVLQIISNKNNDIVI